MTPPPIAERRYAPSAAKRSPLVIPPGEPETERDPFCDACAPLPEESAEE
jgi:hypothetical protein